MRRDRIEAVVVMRDVPGQSHDGGGQRLAGVQCPQTPTEIVAMVNSHEDAERRPVQIARRLRRQRADDARNERMARQAKQTPAIGSCNHRQTAAAM
jgi:hypothetical protein